MFAQSPGSALNKSLVAGRVLGVDPGLTRCGYAVIEAGPHGSACKLALGVIRTSPSTPLPYRLAELSAELDALLDEFSPSAVAVEQVFFQNNVRTAMSVGQASGLALALAAARGCDVRQFSPSQVKDAVAGWGNADKEQVQRMVQQRLSLSTLPKPADAADAAALALCYLAVSPMLAAISSSKASA